MRTKMKAAVVLTAAALLAGCASGGGSSGAGSGSPAADPALQPLRPGYEPSPCGTLYGYPVECQPLRPALAPESNSQQSGPVCFYALYCPESYTGSRAIGSGDSVADQAPAPFTSWVDFGSSPVTQATALGIGWSRYETTSDGSVGSVSDPGKIYVTTFTVPSYANPRAAAVEAFFGGSYAGSLAGGGQPGIDLAVQDVRQVPGAVSPFANFASRITLVANPYVLGCNYQSFGVWNFQDSAGSGSINARSYGAVSPASAVPTSGQATFDGKLAGFYVSPTGTGSMATANLSVGANFSNRSLTFASIGTSITRNPDTATAAPNLNLSGTLSYSPVTNTFSGTLKNTSSTMSGPSEGRFYGNAAQELGGAFVVKSPTTVETFTGAYGAKR